jgi:hypothetical protein
MVPNINCIQWVQTPLKMAAVTENRKFMHTESFHVLAVKE